MQIHELNNFTGTLGSGAYLAIDDGTDTGKISSQGLLAATEARIDNIIAGPAPSAEEIVDARLGADGVTYPSLGDAIRDQFTDVKRALNQLVRASDFIDLSDVTIEDGKYLKSDGSVGTNDRFSLSDYIELPAGVESLTVNRMVYANGQAYPQTKMVWFYDANKTLLNTPTATIQGDLLVSSNGSFSAKYIRVNFYRYSEEKFIKINYSIPVRWVRWQESSETVNDFNQTGFYLIASNFTNAPTNIVGILTVKKNQFGAIIQTYECTNTNAIFTRRRNNSLQWTNWARIYTSDDIGENVLGLLGSYSGTFTSAQQQLTVPIIMKANKTYLIKFYKKIDGLINIFPVGDTSNFKRVYQSYWEVKITNGATDSYLKLYNTNGELGDVQLKIYEVDSIALAEKHSPKTYRVSKNAVEGDYTSLTQCLLDLKNDHDPKIIEIYEGDYDIYQEYQDADVPVYTGTNPALEYFDYCVWIPENTHIIGKGIVRLKWMPTKEANPEITWMQCYAVSPVNVAATMTLENVEIHCKNGRYCIHNDPLGKLEFMGARHIFKNVKCYKYECETDTTTTPGESHIYGTHHTLGFGIDRDVHEQYENCVFINYWIGRAFYGHTRNAVGGYTLTESECGDFTLNNCVFDTQGSTCIKLGNSTNTNLHVRMMFSNCYFSNLIQAISEGSSATRNAFDVTFLNCGDIRMQIDDSSGENRYPPKAYRTNLTIV